MGPSPSLSSRSISGLYLPVKRFPVKRAKLMHKLLRLLPGHVRNPSGNWRERVQPRHQSPLTVSHQLLVDPFPIPTNKPVGECITLAGIVEAVGNGDLDAVEGVHENGLGVWG